MNFLGAFVMFFVLLTPVSAQEKSTPTPWKAQANKSAQACIACADKCAKCGGNAMCVVDCWNHGNPKLVPTCGDRRRC